MSLKEEEKKQFPNVTHYTNVVVQPGGMNIQHVEHLHQADVLKALGIELEIKKDKTTVETLPGKEETPPTDNQHPVAEIVLSDADKALYKRLINFVSNGDWQSPATYDNVRLWISTLFGADMELLDAEDVETTRMFRDFFKGGKAGANTDRAEVSMANILGYLMIHQLLSGGQKQISIDFFGNDDQVNNINKGKNMEGNQEFKRLLPLMDKYKDKIIL